MAGFEKGKGLKTSHVCLSVVSDELAKRLMVSHDGKWYLVRYNLVSHLAMAEDRKRCLDGTSVLGTWQSLIYSWLRSLHIETNSWQGLIYLANEQRWTH